MKRKGFTLIEMLAVIAVLGILVIMVVPNVLKNYRDSKKVAFIDEAKVVYTKATDAYVMGKTKGQKVTYISNEVEDTTQLDLKAKEDLKYTVQLDSKTGVVTSFVLKNTEFCIVGIGDFLNDYTKEQVIDYRDTGSGVNQTAIDLCNSETYRPGVLLEVELVDKIIDNVKTKAKPNNLILKYNQGWYEKGTEKSLIDETGNYKIDEIPTKPNYYYKGSEVEGSNVKVIGCDGKILVNLTGQDPDGKYLFLGKENASKATSQWIPKHYKVSFTGGNGQINTITVNYGEHKNLPSNKDENGYGKNIKKTGYKFAGWLFNDSIHFDDEDLLPVLTDENEDQVVDGIDHKLFKFDNEKVCSGEQSTDEIKSFVAQWTPIKYTVKYDSNGGSGTMEPTTDTYDSNETFRTNTFTRIGYEFLGWSLDKNKTTADYEDGTNIPNLSSLEGDEVTVYAIWKLVSYMVTLDVNGGDAWTSSTCKATFDSSDKSCKYMVIMGNNYGTISSRPNKSNYTFAGWYTNSATTTEVNLNSNVTANITLYARYIGNSVLVEDYAPANDCQQYTVGKTGNYKIELWGAQGGNGGGKGAYTRGNIRFNKGEIFYICIGKEGSKTPWGGSVKLIAGGFNGGGAGRGPQEILRCRSWGSGGGATDIRLNGGAWNDTTGLRSRIMVAAGGGGAHKGECGLSEDGNYAGGVGGTFTGGDGANNRESTRIYSGKYGTNGYGGSQTKAGWFYYRDNGNTAESNRYYSSFGFAPQGKVNTYYAGGGGGYYAGGNSAHVQAAGGGSSFISGYTGCVAINSNGTAKCSTGNSVDCATHYSGKKFTSASMTAGNNSGNGKAKITYLGY